MAVPTVGGFIASQANGVPSMRANVSSSVSSGPLVRIVVFGVGVGSISDSKGNIYTLLKSFGLMSIWMSNIIATPAQALTTFPADWIESDTGGLSWVAHVSDRMAADGFDGLETLEGSYNGTGSDFNLVDPGLTSPPCADHAWICFGVIIHVHGSANPSFPFSTSLIAGGGSGRGGTSYIDGPAYKPVQTGNLIRGHVPTTSGFTNGYQFMAMRWRSADCPPVLPPPTDGNYGMQPCLCRDYTGQFELFHIYTDGSLRNWLYEFDDSPDELITLDPKPGCRDPSFYRVDGALAGTYISNYPVQPQAAPAQQNPLLFGATVPSLPAAFGPARMNEQGLTGLLAGNRSGSAAALREAFFGAGPTGYLFAISGDHGRTIQVFNIPVTWTSMTSQEWKNLVVAIGWNGTAWKVIVGKVTRDGGGNLTVTFGTEGTVTTTTPLGRGNLREALDDELNFVYQKTDQSWAIVTCRDLQASDGSGTWF